MKIAIETNKKFKEDLIKYLESHKFKYSISSFENTIWIYELNCAYASLDIKKLYLEKQNDFQSISIDFDNIDCFEIKSE